jgi:hypothetical protein
MTKHSAAAKYHYAALPSWWSPVKELKLAKFNARAETVTEKPFFRQTFNRNRCFDPDFRLLRVARHAGRQTTLVLYATRRVATVSITLI